MTWFSKMKIYYNQVKLLVVNEPQINQITVQLPDNNKYSKPHTLVMHFLLFYTKLSITDIKILDIGGSSSKSTVLAPQTNYSHDTGPTTCNGSEIYEEITATVIHSIRHQANHYSQRPKTMVYLEVQPTDIKYYIQYHQSSLW